jgi:hypothetical protein
MPLAVELLVRTLICLTILLYSNVLCAELFYIRKLRKVRNPSQYHTISLILPLTCAVVVILYNLHITCPVTGSFRETIPVIELQIFLIAMGLIIMENCSTRIHHVRHRNSLVLATERRLIDLWTQDSQQAQIIPHNHHSF